MSRMRLHVGCEFAYDAGATVPAVVMVQPRIDHDHHVAEEQWQTEPALAQHEYVDLFGNRCERLTLPAGPSRLCYDALVDVSGEPDVVNWDARENPVEHLPDDTLVFTLASRYCLTESLSDVAWHLFGTAEPGWTRVQAVCDWINQNIRYGLPSTPQTTAVDVYVAGGGMCRDFAHLAITFCRALNIPARYVFGYMPDIGVPGPFPPMDFHAWFEVFLDDQWWTFDARFNVPRIGRIPIAVGRDAVDVAMITSYGPASFQHMIVWTDESQARALDDDADDHGGATPLSQSEAVVFDHGAPAKSRGS